MDKTSRIYVAGHNGLVGSAILRCLQGQGYGNIAVRSSADLDLRRQEDVEEFFEREKPEYVFLAAAKVGGIMANSTYPAEFIYSNLVIQTNVIQASYLNRVKKLLFLGSSCIYPKLAPQPLKEDYLLSGPLEPTNEPYAVAKIAGIKMCQAYNTQYGTRYISVMPTNLYGLNDNYDLETSHVVPALIRKVMDAKMSGRASVTIWGTGSPRREFLFVDDLADACVFLMRNYEDSGIINIGVGSDISIKELAEMIGRIVGFTGKFVFDSTRPDGTPQKLLDVSRLNSMGWRAKTSLEEGLAKTIEWFRESYTSPVEKIRK